MRREIWLLAIVILVGIVFRFAVLTYMAPAYPFIDVYIVDQQAPKMILNLQNPYTATYVVHNYTLNVFAYLPMVPIYYVPFSLLGDIRYGNIFADVLIMLALFWIAKAFNCKTALYAPLAFALFPISVWLTSGAATNMMIGTAFLMMTIAMLLQKKFLFASVFLGLGFATNQLVILTLPLFALDFYRKGKLKLFLPSLLIATAVILPFFLASPSEFFFGAFSLQFVRPLQADGPFSLYSILETGFGYQLNTWLRVILFGVPFLFFSLQRWRRQEMLAVSIAVILFLAAFVLPINGMYNYFLPSLALACLIYPFIGDWIDQKMRAVPWWPHVFDDL